jgi:hypothetical protein
VTVCSSFLAGASIALSLGVATSAFAAEQCPSTVKGSKLPNRAWSDTSSKPGWYAQNSAIATLGGIPVVGGASYAQVKSYMGSGFDNATFKNPIAGSTTPPMSGFITCSYKGPNFRHGSQTLFATVTVACKTNCSGL